MMHATGAKTAADIAAADDMQILTLNFNGTHSDLISLLTWLDLPSVDVLCLQESKLAPGSIQATSEAFLRHGYTAHFSTPKKDTAGKPMGGLIVATRRPSHRVKGPKRMVNPNGAMFVQIH